MTEILIRAWYLQIPIIIGGVLHMLAVTKDWLPALRQPVCERWFGANKTWRGFLLMPLLTAAGAICLMPVEAGLGDAAMLGPLPLVTGIIAGLGYTLAELPNSFIKRRLGIAPGAVPETHRQLFIMTDQIDSGIGVALAYLIYPGIDWEICLVYALTFPFTALMIKRLLYWCQLKKSAT